MRRTRRARTSFLPDLFTPPPMRPTWNNLPKAVTQKVTPLLAELLHQHRLPRPQSARRKEADDE